MFLSAGAKASEEELKPILDQMQWKRWREGCMSKGVASRPKSREKAEEDPQGRVPVPEPEEIEQRISEHLYNRTTSVRKRMLEAMTLKVEDAGRAAGLDSSISNRLFTAARGAVEELLVSWKKSTEQNVRSQLANAAPGNVKQALAGMENVNYGNNHFALTDKDPPLWEATVKAALTDAQHAAWKSELDEWKAYRENTVLSQVMVGFARINSLTIEQWEKVEPVVAAVLKEYSQEITQSFSTNWHLQSHSALTPFVGIPEKDLKAILRPDQWERWMSSNEFTNGTNYWTNIEQNHQRRVKPGK